jgi:hypothetical protein
VNRNQSTEHEKKETMILPEVQLQEKPVCVGLYRLVAEH